MVVCTIVKGGLSGEAIAIFHYKPKPQGALMMEWGCRKKQTEGLRERGANASLAFVQTTVSDEDNGEGIKFTQENYETRDVTEAVC